MRPREPPMTKLITAKYDVIKTEQTLSQLEDVVAEYALVNSICDRLNTENSTDNYSKRRVFVSECCARYRLKTLTTNPGH